MLAESEHELNPILLRSRVNDDVAFRKNESDRVSRLVGNRTREIEECSRLDLKPQAVDQVSDPAYCILALWHTIDQHIEDAVLILDHDDYFLVVVGIFLPMISNSPLMVTLKTEKQAAQATTP